MFKASLFACFLCTVLALHPNDLRSCASCCTDLMQQQEPVDTCCAKMTPSQDMGDVFCGCSDPGLWLIMPPAPGKLPAGAVVERLLRPSDVLRPRLRPMMPVTRGHDPPPAPYLRSVQLLI